MNISTHMAGLKTHQELGQQLKLFFFDEKSAGSAFFLPKGTMLYNNLIEFLRKEYRRRGYQEVISPVIFDKSLWKISGHWSKYKENMFMIETNKDDDEEPADDDEEPADDEKRQFSLKPMNCPSHCLIFQKMTPSYRDLPIRLADFGVLHRNEFTGSLRGLSRVRKFCQDDAHIFCAMSQVENEINNVIDFIQNVYSRFKMTLSVGFSSRPDVYVGSIDDWDRSEEILKKIITRFEEHHINDKDGAFYGPKLDFDVQDVLGRKHQLATIQLDFNLPKRFDLRYSSEDGYEQPVLIHRAIFGSFERFIAILLESGQGDIPFFVSPRQVAILCVNSAKDTIRYGKQVSTQLLENDIIAEVYDDDDTLPKKILNAEILHFNYIFVIGKREIANNTINVRGVGERSLDDFMKICKN